MLNINVSSKKKKRTLESYFSRASKKYNIKSNSFPWSILRQRESSSVINTIKKISLGNVLELGCGAGFYTKILLKQNANKIVAIDLSKEMLTSFKDKKVLKICANAENLELNYNFDTIFCAGMIEFCNHPETIFENAHKMSIPKTNLLILLPYKGMFARIYKYFYSINNIKINILSLEDIYKIADKTNWKIDSYSLIWPSAMLIKLKVKKN